MTGETQENIIKFGLQISEEMLSESILDDGIHWS